MTTTDGHLCDMHQWQKIGTVGTGNGMLALVAPYFAKTLGRAWDERLATVPFEGMAGNFEELSLSQTTWKVGGTDEGYEDSESALLVACDNGIYDVEARFCDQYGTGHLTICELRINLHATWHEVERELAGEDEEPA